MIRRFLDSGYLGMSMNDDATIFISSKVMSLYRSVLCKILHLVDQIVIQNGERYKQNALRQLI